ncbi:TIMELESS-interacting protein isoform X1 [Rhincodon typus]|uniref:TIMELESS-interacting protein isoform X1 n=1 Tax=Rhincodon typus TaxID=259920 RepID=UPI0009A3629D|nr:TIMELESS-interacting protein isoform X1 [Rhincodon typus]XP_048471962.1 TIMELESS-interacting protein isoform X1 [Rhincodon typus]XP_048471963.1 TIMELESS-interacting protein isoform X1 [Rhincodon typus]XP_048471964.1 TIMELESS-interacting protein isoform X1 [Rhincodon typus]
MSDTLQNSLSDIPDYDHSEDEIFPPLPPPSSPGQVADGGASDGDEENRQEGNPSKEPVVLRKGVKGPRLKLDAQRLTSDRGLPALRNLFNNVRFKGKGHESEDVKTLLWQMEHWAHRLYPKLQFAEFIEKVEVLGSKKEVQTCLKKIRLDIPITHEDFISKEVVENELQIENLETSFSPLPSKSAAEPTPSSSTLSEEQHLRIERNKQLALQRRQAKLEPTNQMSSNDLSDSPFLSQSAELNQAKILRDPTDSFEDLDAEDMEALKKTTKMESFKSVQQPESPTEGGVCLETSEHLSEVTKTIDCAVSIHESETTIEDNFSKPIPEATTDSQNLPMEQLT